MQIVSFARFGYEGEIVKVEADLRRGIPAIDIVGLPDGAVREARERMRAAIRNSGLDFPRERILINLSPADLKKEGSSFDLPIALAVLGAAEHKGIAPDEGASASEIGRSTDETDDDSVPGERKAVMVLGELELSGAVRGVRGVLSAVSLGLAQGIRWYIVPRQNEEEASIRSDARVIGVETLAEAVARLKELAEHTAGYGRDSPVAVMTGSVPVAGHYRQSRANGNYTVRWPATGNGGEVTDDNPGFEDVRGQNRLVRALQIAAAGGHHLIAYGPPGCGKTLALRRFPALLPELDEHTAVTVTRIYSIAGVELPESGNPLGGRFSGSPGFSRQADSFLPGDSSPSLGSSAAAGRPGNSSPGSNAAATSGRGGGFLRRQAPFREPHQNASLEGIIGGGKQCHPGEISLAHGGVLFLDEAAQFRTTVLQSLRAPLETGTVTVSRAGKADTFPARFQLLMAVNPCPCGNFGAADRVCTCMPEMIERYWKKMTAPLLDRIDLRIAVRPPASEALIGEPTFSTAELRREIGRAREIQWRRNQEGENWLNAHISPLRIGDYCTLGPGERQLFAASMAAGHLSGRGGHAVLKVARTIADLEGSESIREDHLLEAIQFRQWDGMVPDFL